MEKERYCSNCSKKFIGKSVFCKECEDDIIEQTDNA